MRFLGGKSRLGKAIATAIRDHGKHRIGDPIWEAFCGGLGATPHLATLGPVLCSDIDPALISLYRAVRNGWVPPVADVRMHAAAKQLPDSDPVKAAMRFGRSFGGNYSSGFAHNDANNDYDAQFRSSLLATVPAAVSFDAESFFDVPIESGLTLYLDPPYAGTQGYRFAFDSDAFWRRAFAWSNVSHVYVSEFKAPLRWTCVWSKVRSSRHAWRRKQDIDHVERLFYRGPRA